MVPLSDLLLSHRAGNWGTDPGAAEVDARVIRNGDVLSSGEIRWTQLPLRGLRDSDASKARVARDDLVLTTSASCGYVAHVTEEPRDPTCATNFVRVLKVATAYAVPRYLFHFMNREEFRASLAPFIRGTAMKNLAVTEAFERTMIPIPPLADQRRIAKILDRAEALRAKRRAALDQLRGLTQAIFVDLVGDPVNGDRGWPVESIANIAAREKHAIVDGPFGSSLKPHHYKGSGIPVVRIANISKHGDFVPSNLLYIERPLFESLRRSRIRPGDVLISRVGTIGNTCIFPEGVGDALLSTTGVCKITVNPERVLPVFLHQALRMPSFQDQIHKSASTSVQKYFNLTALKSWRLAVPPMEVQRSFAGRVASVEILKAQLRASLAEFDALFATIQYRAFRGEL